MLQSLLIKDALTIYSDWGEIFLTA